MSWNATKSETNHELDKGFKIKSGLRYGKSEILCILSKKNQKKIPYPLSTHDMCLLDFSRKKKMVPEDTFIIWVREAVKQ